MATSKRNFLIELYQEYLEEASFLYEQRLMLYDDPEITWLDIGDYEERFEPYIDGLVIGEELALDVCKIQSKEGDFGELHACMRVFCRQKRKDLVLQTLEEIDADEEEIMKAVADAFKYEFPEDWQNEFLQMLLEGNKRLIPFLAIVSGYRRLKWGRELLGLLKETPSETLPKLIWAFGRIGDQNACPPLLKYLEHEEEFVRFSAALSLLRLGEYSTINKCIEHVGNQNWPVIPLALGADRSSVDMFLELANTRTPKADYLIALGLLGDVSAASTLISFLNTPDTAESAALALQLITGAQLYEEVFVPDEVDEDELFEEELEKYKQGQVPTRLDGEPFGSAITRISQKTEEWEQWWEANRSYFRPGVRYRNGKPYSPACLLDTIKSEHSRYWLRELAYEELVIRYDIDFPFEADMLVSQQKRIIRQYEEWIEKREGYFQNGQWCFKGKVLG